MVAAATALALALSSPWTAPLSFDLHTNGWRTGEGATFHTVWCSEPDVVRSTAWAANVRYRDTGKSDPPNRTLRYLPPGGILVWASIQACTRGWPDGRRRISPHLSLQDAYRFPCCEGEYVPGGEWELYGFGPHRDYSVLVRIYWGSPPTGAMRAEATRALKALRLPALRS